MSKGTGSLTSFLTVLALDLPALVFTIGFESLICLNIEVISIVMNFNGLRLTPDLR